MKSLIAAAAIATTFALAGCNTSGSTAAGTAPKGTNASVKPAHQTKKPSPSSDANQIAKFGQTFKYDDGLDVKVGPPLPYTPSSYAMVEGKGVSVVFTVTVVNQTGKVFDPSMASASVQSGDVEAQEIFDSAKGLNGSPDTKLLPGRQATWREGFKVRNPKDIVFDLTPDFTHQDAIWTNSQ